MNDALDAFPEILTDAAATKLPADMVTAQPPAPTHTLPNAVPGTPATARERLTDAPFIPWHEPGLEVETQAVAGAMGYWSGFITLVDKGHAVPVRLQVTEIHRRDLAGTWHLAHRHSSMAGQ